MSTIHSQTTEPQDFDIEVPDTDATDYTWVPKNRPEVMKGVIVRHMSELQWE